MSLVIILAVVAAIAIVIAALRLLLDCPILLGLVLGIIFVPPMIHHLAPAIATFLAFWG